jgi:hypothetical protein
MNISHRTRTALPALVAVSAIALWPGAADAKGRTETLRYFFKDAGITLTKSDGKVYRSEPLPEPGAGDVLDVYSLGYKGNHRRHARRWSVSDHVSCTFSTGEPDCLSHTAIGGSMLIFVGFPGKLIAGTGRYQGATGRVISNKEVEGGSDAVAKIQLAGRARSAAQPAAPEPAWERALRLRGEAMNEAMLRLARSSQS